MDNRFSMKGSNAVVTGATRGIGLAIVRGFLESGATVTLCGRKQEGVDDALADLADHASNVLGVAAHVGKVEDIERLIASAEERFGPVNTLVNNAGTNPYYGPIADSEDWAWDKTMDVNLRGPYLLSRRVGVKMTAEGGGSIINISSIAGLAASVNQGIYSVTKAGLIMLTKVMAREMGGSGVLVNCICPGVIRTQLSRALWEDEKAAKKYLARKALGRIGEVDEVVGAAIYFASEASSFTTGAVLQVDGGMVI
ncbi:MAG: glucose 1-dehydrogenase [Gemmatimonadota bacterium]|nr:glucose 1-dehydrogenase [Gemmatimonadota bacterium]